MPTYVITDDTKSLCLAISGGETKNIDKDNAVVRVIPANTGLNTTAIDQLSIEHDGHFATRIPYNDVTVSGVSPSSVLDFRTKVLTILNNNSSGGGDMTAAVYDPAGYATQVTVRDIQTNVNAAQALLASSGAAITAGQGYIIDNGGVAQLPTGISLMRVVGIDLPAGAKGFDPNAEAYITALATYVPCTYDVGTNKVNVTIETVFRVTQTADNGPTLEVMKNDLTGVTFTAGYGDPGKYNIIPSISLSTLGTGPFNEVYVHMTGTQVIGEDVVNPFGLVSGFYDELNDTMRLGSQVVDFGTNALVPTDGIFNGIPIYLICILSN